MENTEKKENMQTAAEPDLQPEAEKKPEGEKKEKKNDSKKIKAELAEALAKCERLESELAAEKDKCLRIAAEYDNFRRTQKEKESIYTDATCDAIKEILPLLDNLGRAGQFTEADKVAEGVRFDSVKIRGHLFFYIFSDVFLVS